MNQPWGLSGPQFLLIYGAGMAAFLAAAWLLAPLAQTFSTAPGQVPAPVLDAYEVGYLAEGAPRAAEVVIGELAASGALRVDSTGQISKAAPARLAAWSASCGHGIAAGAIPDGLRTRQVRHRLAKDPGIVAIGVRLRAERLLFARPVAIAAQVTVLALWLALIVAGALRVVEGINNDRPTNGLVLLYTLTLILGVLSLGPFKNLRWMKTRAGAGYLESLPGLTGARGEAALLAVALAGLIALPNPTLRTALLTGLPPSGGGSDGGGGGGGGGCGGGCGG